jgi:hypothetical protein
VFVAGAPCCNFVTQLLLQLTKACFFCLSLCLCEELTSCCKMGCSPHVSLMLIILAFTLVNQALVCLGQPGTWQLLLENAGIASMHTAVTHYGTVVFLDRTDIGASQINLPNGECRNDPNDAVCCQEHFRHFSTSFSSSRIECGFLHAELQFTTKISTPMKK